MAVHEHYPELNERQEAVFTALLQEYITTARGVASRTLSKRLPMKLSPATIRNVMSDLEELGLLASPHTSAGRVPTTLAYGMYVDHLMERVDVSVEDQQKIRAVIEEAESRGVSKLLERTNEVLAHTSALISVVLAPRLATGILHRIDLVRIASRRVMIVLTIRGGFVRTILLNVVTAMDDREIDAASRLLNQRLSGLRLSEVKRSIDERLRGSDQARSPLIQLVLNSAETIFSDDRAGDVHVDGTPNVLAHPEFANLDQMRGVIEILEDRDVILHVLHGGEHQTEEGVRISIGEEIEAETLRGCSVLATAYKVGDAEGSLGIIGPKRMDYARLVPLVNFAASALHSRFEE
jgi:heat-inducible transcriptional repressor